ncbi:SHOCT domain-containing protein [SAR202 cluster bacterium AC-647-P02_OGT_505m]|nr:SHOCT domain-containing protein [SAR202 cluster bacterium AC-647-P02_OGT_505m]
MMTEFTGPLPVLFLVVGAALFIESTETFIQIGSTGTSMSKIKVSRLDKSDAEETISAIATSLHKSDSGDSPMSAQNVVESDSTSNLDELEKLASLRDKGILTEDEFNSKKKELLGL